MTTTSTQITPTTAEMLLHDLVSTSSISRHEAAAVRLLVRWMMDQKFDQAFVDDAGNAVGIMGKGDGSKDIVMLGHIDTFPGTPTVKIEDRRLYGRGSVDAKGPLCTFAAATAHFKSKLPRGVRLIVIGAVEEETSTSKGAFFAASQYQPQYCIIGEPSNWDRITLGYKGRLILKWRWEGPFAHSAGEQPTAGERAFDYWKHVQNYASEYSGDTTSIFATLDASIRDITTSSIRGGTHQRGELTVGFRLPPNLQPETVEAALQPDDENATLIHLAQERTYVAEKDNLLTRAMRVAIRSENGKPRFVYKTGTSDMNVVGPRWNCPIIAYGPGDSALDHTPNEHLNLDEYGSAIRVLTTALERLVGEL